MVLDIQPLQKIKNWLPKNENLDTLVEYLKLKIIFLEIVYQFWFLKKNWTIFFCNENFPTLKLKVEIWNFELFQVRYWLDTKLKHFWSNILVRNQNNDLLKNHKRFNKGTNKLHGLSLPLAKLTFYMVITKGIAFLFDIKKGKEGKCFCKYGFNNYY